MVGLNFAELLKRDKRIKPTVVLPMKSGSPDTEEEEDSVEPPPPVVSPEARKAIRTLEIIETEKQRLNEGDQRRAKGKNHKFQKKLTAPEKAKKDDPGRALHSKKAKKKKLQDQ
jgi:hypothetical protein